MILSKEKKKLGTTLRVAPTSQKEVQFFFLKKARNRDMALIFKTITMKDQKKEKRKKKAT